MPTDTPQANWPQHLTRADYARACKVVTGVPVSRQALEHRISKGYLAVEEITIDGVSTDYIDTAKYPPGPGPGRWPNRPLPLPKKEKPA